MNLHLARHVIVILLISSLAVGACAGNRNQSTSATTTPAPWDPPSYTAHYTLTVDGTALIAEGQVTWWRAANDRSRVDLMIEVDTESFVFSSLRLAETGVYCLRAGSGDIEPSCWDVGSGLNAPQPLYEFNVAWAEGLPTWEEDTAGMVCYGTLDDHECVTAEGVIARSNAHSARVIGGLMTTVFAQDAPMSPDTFATTNFTLTLESLTHDVDESVFEPPFPVQPEPPGRTSR